MPEDDHHSARIEVKGIAPADLEIIEIHAEAIARSTGAETDLLSTYQGADADD